MCLSHPERERADEVGNEGLQIDVVGDSAREDREIVLAAVGHEKDDRMIVLAAVAADLESAQAVIAAEPLDTEES